MPKFDKKYNDRKRKLEAACEVTFIIVAALCCTFIVLGVTTWLA